MPYSSIIVPKVAEGFVSHQTNLGVDSYDLNELYSPDTEVWKSKVLNLGSPKYPPQDATAPTRYWFDRSRYRNHGTITGAVWSRQPSGIWALSFDGTDDSVNCGTGSSLDFGWQSTFTLELWIKTSQASGSYKYVIGRSTDSLGWMLCVHSTKIRLYLSKTWNADWIVVDSTNAVNDGKWHHVAATYSGSGAASGVVILVDGVSVASIVADTLTGEIKQTAEPALLGNRAGFGAYSGLMDLCHAYNAVKTPSSLAQNYRLERGMFGV